MTRYLVSDAPKWPKTSVHAGVTCITVHIVCLYQCGGLITWLFAVHRSAIRTWGVWIKCVSRSFQWKLHATNTVWRCQDSWRKCPFKEHSITAPCHWWKKQVTVECICSCSLYTLTFGGLAAASCCTKHDIWQIDNNLISWISVISDCLSVHFFSGYITMVTYTPVFKISGRHVQKLTIRTLTIMETD